MAAFDTAQLLATAKSGKQVHFDAWEQNPGIVAMRDVLASTEPNTANRMRGAQAAFPPIKALWEQMSTGALGMMLPADMKKAMNTLFSRIAVDKEYAKKVYNVFPVIADRYGSGNQTKGRDKGKPRLSFVHMAKDPLCKGLI